MKYSDAIKLLRKRLLLTQTEFAEKLNVSFTTISRWEHDICEPTMKMKKKLAPLFEEYNIKVDEE